MEFCYERTESFMLLGWVASIGERDKLSQINSNEFFKQLEASIKINL